MKYLPVSISLAVLFLNQPQPLLGHEFENRTWKSKNGQEIEAMIIGVDEDGKVLLQPLKPYKVALDSLSEEDQAFVKKWEVEHAEDAELLKDARMERLYAAPVMQILKRGLNKFEKTAVTPYPIEEPGAIKFVVFYLTLEGDRMGKAVSDAYEKLRRRNPTFEFVAISFDDSLQAMQKHFSDNKLTMPFLDFDFKNQIRGTVLGGMAKVYPQLIALDVNGKVLANSYEGESNEVNILGALSEIEKLARETARSSGATEDESEE